MKDQDDFEVAYWLLMIGICIFVGRAIMVAFSGV